MVYCEINTDLSNIDYIPYYHMMNTNMLSTEATFCLRPAMHPYRQMSTDLLSIEDSILSDEYRLAVY